MFVSGSNTAQPDMLYRSCLMWENDMSHGFLAGKHRDYGNESEIQGTPTPQLQRNVTRDLIVSTGNATIQLDQLPD